MGFNYTGSQIHPVTVEIMRLREELQDTPWWHIIKRSAMKDTLYHLETVAFGIVIEQALDDLEKAGVIKIINEQPCK